jgi:hypothetical protein
MRFETFIHLFYIDIEIMKANLSIGECIIRIFVGVIWGAVFGSVFSGYVALIGVLAIYPIVTGLGGWDPFFAVKKKYTNEDNPYEGHESHNTAPVSTSRMKPGVNEAA